MKVTRNHVMYVFLVIMLLACIAVGVFAISMTPQMRFRNSPEQSQEVMVVKKRIERDLGSGRGAQTVFRYIVAFQFSDGSVKELKVGLLSISGTGNPPYCAEYALLNKGDIGTLVYKEIANIEEKYKDEDMRHDGRIMVSFKKRDSASLSPP